MHLVSVDNIPPDSILGRSIYDERLELLLATGYKLDARITEMLKGRGYTYVYVMDGVADDLKIEEMIDVTLRKASGKTIEKAFEIIRSNPTLKSLEIKEIEQRLDVDPKLKNLIPLTKFRRMALDLIEEIIANNVHIFSSLPQRSDASQEIEHAIDTALLCLLMGQSLNMLIDDLRSLVTSALLHDVGKFVLQKPKQKKTGAPDTESQTMLREHPTYSMLIVKGSDSTSYREQTAVHQHHEQLDGNGYPLGLKSKDLQPEKRRAEEKRQIFWHSAILAVANQYDILVSGKLDGKTRTPEQALGILIKQAGITWNSYAVRALGQVVQLYPVGCRVRVRTTQSSEIAGHFGVVVRNNPKNPTKPEIVLTHNNLDVKINPIHVNFALDKRVKLEIVL